MIALSRFTELLAKMSVIKQWKIKVINKTIVLLDKKLTKDVITVSSCRTGRYLQDHLGLPMESFKVFYRKPLQVD